ncbi:MAG: lysine--tRNA ligase, partial [Gemmatirosa sp.]|nr:lysine--tRNA ligase [Gemmatirosa sp.]
MTEHSEGEGNANPAASSGAETSQLLRARREKLAALQQRGIAPFAYRFDRTHTTSEAVAAHEVLAQATEVPNEAEGPMVRVAGRLTSWRSKGKTAFAHLADAVGRVQLYFRRDVVGDEWFDVLQHLIDIGDVVGIDGVMFRTRAGEVTVRVERVELLAKSL